MKLTYRKTLSGAPYGIEEIIVEEEVCLQDVPQILRSIRERVKIGLSAQQPTAESEGPLDSANRLIESKFAEMVWSKAIQPKSGTLASSPNTPLSDPPSTNS